jgi:hypothetical protein
MNAIIVPNARPEREEQSTSLIQVIERAARDSSIDIDKMERLLAMKERLDAKTAVEAYSADFALMQPELPEITEKGEIKVENKVRSTYAKFEDINAVVKPILAKHGFGLSFKTSTKDNKVTVVAVLMHRGGHSERTEMELGADTSGSKNGVQALGSSISYAKRYTMNALLNITTRGQDDDGQNAGPKISEEQLADLMALIEEKGGNKGRLLKYWKLKSFGDLPACNYAIAVEEVKAFAKQREDASR